MAVGKCKLRKSRKNAASGSNSIPSLLSSTLHSLCFVALEVVIVEVVWRIVAIVGLEDGVHAKEELSNGEELLREGSSHSNGGVGGGGSGGGDFDLNAVLRDEPAFFDFSVEFEVLAKFLLELRDAEFSGSNEGGCIGSGSGGG